MHWSWKILASAVAVPLLESGVPAWQAPVTPVIDALLS